MFDSDLIATTFRIVNFFVVISLFVYLFKKYLLKDLKTNISKYKNFFLNLRKQSTELDHIAHSLDFEIAYQEHLARNLKDKISIWKEHQQKIIDNQLKEKQIINDEINKKFEKQQALITFDTLKKDILKDVFVEIQTNLKKDFQQKNQLVYQAEIIEFLKNH